MNETEHPAQSAELPAEPITLEERRAILQAAIKDRVRRGYRVMSQTDTTAQVVKAKTFSFGFALLWLLVFGVGVTVYLLHYAAKRDRQHYLTVDGRGRVIVTAEL
jgi:hypothetical protein